MAVAADVGSAADEVHAGMHRQRFGQEAARRVAQKRDFDALGLLERHDDAVVGDQTVFAGEVQLELLPGPLPSDHPLRAAVRRDVQSDDLDGHTIDLERDVHAERRVAGVHDPQLELHRAEPVDHSEGHIREAQVGDRPAHLKDADVGWELDRVHAVGDPDDLVGVEPRGDAQVARPGIGALGEPGAGSLLEARAVFRVGLDEAPGDQRDPLSGAEIGDVVEGVESVLPPSVLGAHAGAPVQHDHDVALVAAHTRQSQGAGDQREQGQEQCDEVVRDGEAAPGLDLSSEDLVDGEARDGVAPGGAPGQEGHEDGDREAEEQPAHEAPVADSRARPRTSRSPSRSSSGTVVNAEM